jgi:hypothetical protein
MNARIQAGNKFILAATAAAAVLVISFFLPWMTASFGGYGSISMSWMDYITTAGSPWSQDVQSLLVVLAAVAAPVCAFLVFVQGRRSQAFLGVTLLSFVGAAIGSAWLLVQFNQTFGLSEGMSQAWVCGFTSSRLWSGPLPPSACSIRPALRCHRASPGRHLRSRARPSATTAPTPLRLPLGHLRPLGRRRAR